MAARLLLARAAAICWLQCCAALRWPSTPTLHRRRHALGLGAGFGAGALLLRHPAPVAAAFTEEDYNRDPADITRAVLPNFPQRDVFLHFHGRGGPDREDADLIARVKSQDALAGLDRFVHQFVWREWLEAASTERISYTGQAIGRKIGRALASRDDLRSLHVCGTSAGGFAANECISAYVAAADPGRRASTRLTLCDPFCARADEVGAPWDDGSRTSGARLFGRDADFAEHFLNSDDVVPSTNFPLPRCFIYDVTGAAERAQFPPPSTGNLLQDLGLRLLGYHNCSPCGNRAGASIALSSRPQPALARC